MIQVDCFLGCVVVLELATLWQSLDWKRQPKTLFWLYSNYLQISTNLLRNIKGICLCTYVLIKSKYVPCDIKKFTFKLQIGTALDFAHLSFISFWYIIDNWFHKAFCASVWIFAARGFWAINLLASISKSNWNARSRINRTWSRFAAHDSCKWSVWFRASLQGSYIYVRKERLCAMSSELPQHWYRTNKFWSVNSLGV